VDACTRIAIEDDVIRQARVLLREPLLERFRFPVIDAGVAQEYP
jgi:hypothetical protein